MLEWSSSQGSLRGLPNAVQVTVEDIEALEGEFRGSPEETAELLELHERFSGEMGKARYPSKTQCRKLLPRLHLHVLCACLKQAARSMRIGQTLSLLTRFTVPR